MLQWFPITGTDQQLLVVNVHAINFVMLHTFEAFIKQLISAMKNHHGPILLAGDFNTWINIFHAVFT